MLALEAAAYQALGSYCRGTIPTSSPSKLQPLALLTIATRAMNMEGSFVIWDIVIVPLPPLAQDQVEAKLPILPSWEYAPL